MFLKWIARYSTLLFLLLSMGWFVQTRDWEPAIATISFFVLFVGLDIKIQQLASVMEEQKQADKELFAKYREMLVPHIIREVLHDHDFSYAIRSDHLHSFQPIRQFFPLPEAHFLISEIETSRQNFEKALDTFYEATLRYLFPAHGAIPFLEIPIEWKHNREDTEEFQRFQKYRKELNESATLAYQKYEDFIRIGRSLLNVV